MIILTIPLTAPSLNKFLGRSHWSKRHEITTLWYQEILIAVRKNKIKPITKFPVNIRTQSFFKDNRPRDRSNWITANKFGVDGLVRCGILPDDSGEYVWEDTVLPLVYGHDKNETVITIEEAGEFS